MGKKQKKEKIIYIDDGSTVADMSGVTGPRLTKGAYESGVKFKEAWKTYWRAVGKMFGPMMIVICGICVIYMILYFIFSIM